MPFMYGLYGLSIKSHWPLPCGGSQNSSSEVIELVKESTTYFSQFAHETAERRNGDDPYLESCLADGSVYLRWHGMFEFLVSSDGSRITASLNREYSSEALMTYLLGQALSLALIKKGFDPLHSTAVLVDGSVVGILGGSGYGKSSLAAAFLQSGFPIVTDDLFVVQENESRLCIYPGVPRLKLFPEIAQVFLGSQHTGPPMNSLTHKLIIPLNDSQVYGKIAPLGRLYVLTRPLMAAKFKRVTIRNLSKRLAFVALLRNTFATILVDSVRIRKQFELYTRIASTVPVKMIGYARTVTAAAMARDAILQDLEKHV